MHRGRSSLTVSYVIACAAVFCSAEVILAVLTHDLGWPGTVKLIVCLGAAAVALGAIAAVSAAAIGANLVGRIPSPAKDLAEIRDQLSHITFILRDEQPEPEIDPNQAIQEQLAQTQHTLQTVLAKLDALRLAAPAIPSRSARQQPSEKSDTIPMLRDDEPAYGSEPEADSHESTPAFVFRPTPPDEDATPPEQFSSLPDCQARVEDLMALSKWEEAIAIVDDFYRQHGDEQETQDLHHRVHREYDIYRESSVRRMYEQMKDELERKHYRRALSLGRRLLDKFPDHKKVHKIRKQLPTILENAEIEERQEEEQRIQGFIKTKRFQDAVELSEALIAKYPMSPQADSLEEMLPRLRQLAIEQEAETLGQR